MAERRWLRRSTAELNDHPSVELPGNGISSGSSCTHRRGEEKRSDDGLSRRDQSKPEPNQRASEKDWSDLRHFGEV